MALALAAVRVGDDDLARTRDHHQPAPGVGHVAHRAVEADDAVGLGLDARHRRTRRRATDVEGPHRQLRAGLADRLRRDDADGLTLVDQAAAAQVTAVALGADAEAGVAGQRVRTLTSSTPAASSSSIASSSSMVPFDDQDFLGLGCSTSTAVDAAEDAVAQATR